METEQESEALLHTQLQLTTTSSSSPSGTTKIINGHHEAHDKEETVKRKMTMKKNTDMVDGKHPKYIGVRMRPWGKWDSQIREPTKRSRMWLGSFPTAEMAARAHDVAALSFKGASAFLNFPELATVFPRPASNSPKDVQAAAVKAAAINYHINRQGRPKPESEIMPAMETEQEESEALLHTQLQLTTTSSSSSGTTKVINVHHEAHNKEETVKRKMTMKKNTDMVDGKHPKYIGVRLRRWGRWDSQIREPKNKSRMWLGSFPTAEMAARAYDVAALSFRGASAFLNFPELATVLPRPASNSPKDVRAAAAKAAAINYPINRQGRPEPESEIMPADGPALSSLPST